MLSMKQEVSLAERTYILQYIQEERLRLYFSRKNSSFENLYWIARMKFISVHTVYKNRKISKLNALLFDRRTLWFRCFSRKTPGRQGFFSLLFAVASRNKVSFSIEPFVLTDTKVSRRACWVTISLKLCHVDPTTMIQKGLCCYQQH